MDPIIEKKLAFVLEYAKKKGATKSEVLFHDNAKFSLKSNDGELEQYSIANSQVWGIRVVKDRKIGLSYSESLEENALTEMVDQALNFTKYSAVDEFQDISIVHADKIISDSAQVYRQDETSLAEKIDFALSLEAAPKKLDSAVVGSPYNGYSDIISKNYIANSEGTICFEKQKVFSCFTSALIEKDGKSAMNWHGNNARTFAELGLDDVVNTSYNLASELLNGEQIKTGHYDIIFSQDQLATLLNIFATLFSGKKAMDGRNPYRDKLGEKIAHQSLTIKDIPLYTAGLGYQLFDSEGCLGQEIALIDRGLLNEFYHNSETANYFKCKNNGHASRTARSALKIASSNLVISLGATSHNELYGGTVLEILETGGVHSGADPISGDFSFAGAGYLWKNGKKIHPVKGVTVSGNFYQMLKNMAGIGDKLYPDIAKRLFAPIIRWSDLTIGGS